MERRLAAILAADVVGYSRLVDADEEGTLERPNVLRSDLIDPKNGDHHGRIVRLLGDGALNDFTSVVDVVRGAVALQKAIDNQNTDVLIDKGICLTTLK